MSAIAARASRSTREWRPSVPTELKTHHKLHHTDAGDMGFVGDASVDLVVTSPPYPMIKMWDAHFARQDPAITHDLQNGRPRDMFARMQALLEPVWTKFTGCCARGALPASISGMPCVVSTVSSGCMPTTCTSWIIFNAKDLPACPISSGASPPTRPPNLWTPACCRPGQPRPGGPPNPMDSSSFFRRIRRC